MVRGRRDWGANPLKIFDGDRVCFFNNAKKNFNVAKTIGFEFVLDYVSVP